MNMCLKSSEKGIYMSIAFFNYSQNKLEKWINN